MRVVFVTHNYPRHAGDLAGAFLHPLAVALVRRGHDVRVVAPSDAGQAGGAVVDGVTVVRVRYGRPERERYAYTGRMQEALRSPAGWVAMARLSAGLRRAARAEAAGAPRSVVHAHWWFPAALAAPPELPCVVTLHGTDARLMARGPAARRLARHALRPPRLVTAVSRAVAELARASTGWAVKPANICPMPVVGEVHPSAGGKGIVFVGRLTDQKRLDLALRALALLPATIPLTIVGDGPARPSLETLAATLGLGDRVRFVGRVGPAEVPGWLRDADAFVFPAQAEGLGLAAVEALLAGVPVVACVDGGGVLDVFDQSGTGRLVDPMPDAIAAALAELVANPAARAGAHRSGLAWRDRLTPDRVAERCESWYHEAARA